MHLNIITPTGTTYDGEADALVVPGLKGWLGILPRHAPMICALREGSVNVRCGFDTLYFAVGYGMLEVQDDAVTILTGTAHAIKQA